MSQVIIEMGRADFGGIGVMAIAGGEVEEITSSGTSQATTAVAQAGWFCTVINNGAETIWVQSGASPTAAAGSGRCIPPNSSRDFGGLAAGDKIAVINDS